MREHSISENLRAAVSDFTPIDGIRALLDAASSMADTEGVEESHATDKFTFLQQLIDNALARAEQIAAEQSEGE